MKGENMDERINILFGTETGNSEDLADRLSQAAQEKGLAVRKANVEDVKVSELAEMQTLVIIISTWGDGDPPMSAEEFCESLASEQNLDLSKTRYAVLSLGDTNYPEFCACGKQVDADLARLGAKAFLERKDLDSDFDYHYDEWQDAIVNSLVTA